MFKIDIQANFSQIQKDLEGIKSSRIGYLLSRAANKTAEATKKHIQSQIPKYINSPTNFTINSMMVEYGNRKTNPDATVKWKSQRSKYGGAGHYLIPIAEGGARRLKAMEHLLQSKKLMPSGYYAVPSNSVEKDQYGNVRGGLVVAILSYVRAFYTDNHSMNRSFKVSKRNAKREFFIAQINQPSTIHLAPGIYERKGLRIVPVFFFVPKVEYKVTFPFHQLARTYSDSIFRAKLLEAINEPRRKKAA